MHPAVIVCTCMYTGSLYTCTKVASVPHTNIKHSNQGKPGTETNMRECGVTSHLCVAHGHPVCTH